MRVLKIVGGILAGLVVAIALLLFVVRMGDGPLGPLLGGPLESGELVGAPVRDWGFAASIEEIEMQLVADDVSRTTWILVDGPRAYIPAALGFPPGKDWYVRADVEGAAIVRIDGKRYPVRLVVANDEATRDSLRRIAVAKYTSGRPPEGEVWFFELRSRKS